MLNQLKPEIMPLHFYKYQGAGNDFILLDNRTGLFNPDATETIRNWCDRRFGVGADGLMLLQKHDSFDFEMLYYNADGNPGSMCGNGGRCIVAFAKHLNIIDSETNFLAVDGPHYAKISAEGDWIELQMINVDTLKRDGEDYVLNTGSPHYIQKAKDLEHKNVYKDGLQIRNGSIYKQDGINVNFVEDKGDYLFVRTFERGVEDETFACGTGVTAVAIAMADSKGLQGHIETNIKVLGGDLKVRFEADQDKFSEIFLCGPAKLVFEGEI